MTDIDLQDIKDKHPIKEVADMLGLKYRGNGGKCFAHEDKHPSFVYMPDVNRFECKSCGIKGDVIELVMQVKNLHFLEAVDFLEPPILRAAEKPDPPKPQTPQEYLDSRGISPEMLAKFNVRIEGTKVAIPVPNGTKYRLFTGNIRFIQTEGSKGALFKTEPADKVVILCEGELDAIKLYQEVGLSVWTGTVGADTFRPEWVEDFKDIEKIYIAYDNDEAGRKGTQKVINALGSERCYRVNLPAGVKDVTEYFQAGYTSDQFKTVLKDARPAKVTLQDLVDTEDPNSFTVKCGIEAIDENAKFEGGNAYLVGGCEKSGKSAFCLNIAVNLLKQGTKISYVNTEFTLKEFTSRLTAIDAHIGYATVTADQRRAYLTKIENSLNYSGIGIDPIEFDPILVKLQQEIDAGSKVVFFDNVTTFSNNPPKGVEGWKEQARVMNKMKDLAKEKNVVVFVVLHTKDIPFERTVTKVKNMIADGTPSKIFNDSLVVMAKPTNANLYGGLRIASQFSGTILIWRPYLKFGDPFFNATTLIILESFRNASSGTSFETLFNGAIPSFELVVKHRTEQ